MSVTGSPNSASSNSDILITMSTLAQHRDQVIEAKKAAAGTAANVKEAKGAAATAVKNNEDAQKVSAAAAQALAEKERDLKALIKVKEKELKVAKSNVETIVTELAKLERPFTHRHCWNHCNRSQCVGANVLLILGVAAALIFGVDKIKESVHLN